MALSNGIQVPRWVVAAVSAALTLILVGASIGADRQAQNDRARAVDYRLCRIERALQIEPWMTCPEPQRLSGGGPVR